VEPLPRHQSPLHISPPRRSPPQTSTSRYPSSHLPFQSTPHNRHGSAAKGVGYVVLAHFFTSGKKFVALTTSRRGGVLGGRRHSRRRRARLQKEVGRRRIRRRCTYPLRFITRAHSQGVGSRLVGRRRRLRSRAGKGSQKESCGRKSSCGTRRVQKIQRGAYCGEEGGRRTKGRPGGRREGTARQRDP
jgi:hypothetical protein